MTTHCHIRPHFRRTGRTGYPTDAITIRVGRYPTDAITVRCDRCTRVGRYKRLSLIERYGRDAAMSDVLNAITACERNAKLSTDRCKAYFEELRATEPRGATH